MEIADVCACTGRVMRICTDADDLEALRLELTKQARAAATLAAAAMVGGWDTPAQPVKIQPMRPAP